MVNEKRDGAGLKKPTPKRKNPPGKELIAILSHLLEKEVKPKRKTKDKSLCK